MAYIGTDPELAAAAAEITGDAPAPKSAKAKARDPEPEEEQPEPEEQPAPPVEEEPEPAAAKSDDEEGEPPAEEPKPKEEDEDKKVSKGLAAVARSQKKLLEQKADFERRANAQVTQLETRAQDIDRREAQIAEREARAGRWEQVAERARGGDYGAFWTLAGEMGVTVEAAEQWLSQVPQSPADRATHDRLAALERELAENKKAQREAEERAKQQAATDAQRRANEAFVAAAQDGEKYPYLTIKSGPQLLQEAFAILNQLREEGTDPSLVRDEQLLSYMNGEAEKALRSNDKLRALFGAAPQQNGHNGAPAMKPATARTLTQQMTSERARASVIGDDDDDAASLAELSELKRKLARDAARA